MNDKSNVIQDPTSTSNEPAVGTTVGVSRRSFVGSAALAGMALATDRGRHLQLQYKAKHKEMRR